MQKLSRHSETHKKGTATVEAAVCLPLLLVLVFGSIEASNAIFLKQSLSMAAYETVKTAAAPVGTDTAARQRCGEVMAVRDISNYDVSFSPASVTATTPRGTRIGVTVTADADAAALGPLWFFTGRKLSATVYMVRL